MPRLSLMAFITREFSRPKSVGPVPSVRHCATVFVAPNLELRAGRGIACARARPAERQKELPVRAGPDISFCRRASSAPSDGPSRFARALIGRAPSAKQEASKQNKPPNVNRSRTGAVLARRRRLRRAALLADFSPEFIQRARKLQAARLEALARRNLSSGIVRADLARFMNLRAARGRQRAGNGRRWRNLLAARSRWAPAF